MKGKCPSIKLKESNEVAKGLPIWIPTVVIPSTLVKNMSSQLDRIRST